MNAAAHESKLLRIRRKYRGSKFSQQQFFDTTGKIVWRHYEFVQRHSEFALSFCAIHNMVVAMDADSMTTMFDALCFCDDVMAHGSPAEMDVIEARSHPLAENKPVVFGTRFWMVALTYAAKWGDDQISQRIQMKRIKGGDYQLKIFMYEKAPDVFKNVFDKEGWLYFVRADKFELLNPKENPIDYVSRENVNTHAKVKISNILELLEALPQISLVRKE